MHLKPFFSYYGSKWGAAKTYPSPRYDVIIEPFAGSAGYSCYHSAHKVILVDSNPTVVGVWQYLLKATPSEILALPDVQEHIDEHAHLPQEVRWLMGYWLKKAGSKPNEKVSRWMRDYPTSSFWGQRIRERLAQQVEAIRHWKIIEGDYTSAGEKTATWFIDPPYIGKRGAFYINSSAQLDYSALGEWCRARKGHIIVCEGSGADWLPFEAHAGIKSMKGGRHRSDEVVWTNFTGGGDDRTQEGTPEWIEETIRQIRLQLKAVEGDCRIVADKLPRIQKACEEQGIAWETFCVERLEVTPEFIGTIVRGVEALRGRGHSGKWNAETVAAVEPLTAHGGFRWNAETVAAVEPLADHAGQGDNITLTGARGTSASYIVARLKRDAPEIAEALGRGEFKSPHAAGIAAGFIKKESRLEKILRWIGKMTPEERAELREKLLPLLSEVA